MKLKTLISTGVVTALFISSFAMVQAKPHGKCHGGPRLETRLLKKLDLTEDQKEALQAHRESMKAQKPERPELTGAQKATIDSFFANSQYDSLLATEIAGFNADKSQAMKVFGLQYHHGVLQILTLEQREELKALKAKWQERCENGRPGKPGKPGRPDRP